MNLPPELAAHCIDDKVLHYHERRDDGSNLRCYGPVGGQGEQPVLSDMTVLTSVEREELNDDGTLLVREEQLARDDQGTFVLFHRQLPLGMGLIEGITPERLRRKTVQWVINLTGEEARTYLESHEYFELLVEHFGRRTKGSVG